MLKALFVLEKFTFLSWLFGSVEIMTSQTGQQIITKHLLSDISRSKGNQTMTFGQLIEYNVRYIFL